MLYALVMRKRLHALGNSLAVIIDRPTCKLLGINRSSELEVWTDGRRLILEPIRKGSEAPKLTASELDALPVFNALVEKFGMSQEQFAQLHHTTMRMFAYRGGLATGLADGASDQDRATFRRFEACLRALQRGASWSDAIIVALHAEPKPGSSAPAEAPPALDASDDHACIVVDAGVYSEGDDDPPDDGVEVSWAT